MVTAHGPGGMVKTGIVPLTAHWPISIATSLLECHDGRMSKYWTPLRDEAQRYWQRVRERREAEERDRRGWIEDVKRRLGIRCIGDEESPPGWPVVDVPPGSAYTG